MKKILYLLSSAVVLMACESKTYEEISDNTPITEVVKYEADVKPIIETNCIGCHSPGGPAASKPLTSYNLVKANIDNIIDRIQRPIGAAGRMPPGTSLSQTQINFFIKWKADGLTEN